jgi:hypothetical protein
MLYAHGTSESNFVVVGIVVLDFKDLRFCCYLSCFKFKSMQTLVGWSSTWLFFPNIFHISGFLCISMYLWRKKIMSDSGLIWPMKAEEDEQFAKCMLSSAFSLTCNLPFSWSVLNSLKQASGYDKLASGCWARVFTVPYTAGSSIQTCHHFFLRVS